MLAFNNVVRRVGVRLVVAGEGTGRVFFGPFARGEKLEGITLAYTTATVTAGSQLSVDIRAFSALPADTSAAFAANGRSLVGNGTAATLPRLPVANGEATVPVGWVCPGNESWVGVEVGIEVDTDIDGSVWAWVVAGCGCGGSIPATH